MNQSSMAGYEISKVHSMFYFVLMSDYFVFTSTGHCILLKNDLFFFSFTNPFFFIYFFFYTLFKNCKPPANRISDLSIWIIVKGIDISFVPMLLSFDCTKTLPGFASRFSLFSVCNSFLKPTKQLPLSRGMRSISRPACINRSRAMVCIR